MISIKKEFDPFYSYWSHIRKDVDFILLQKVLSSIRRGGGVFSYTIVRDSIKDYPR